jgi:hypothetical protein
MSAARFILCASFACAVAGCGPDEQLVACNIAERQCQEDVYYALLRLRGDGFDPLVDIPPILTVTREDYCRALDESQPDPAPAPEEPEAPEPEAPEPEPEPEEKPLVPWDFALHTLRLVTPTKTTGQAGGDDLCSVVAAFYASAQGSVTVIDNGPRPDETPEDRARRELAETSLLLHELVHALQDRELSGAQFDGTTDSKLTASALTEGEATFYQRIAEREMIDGDPAGFDWDTYYADWTGWGRATVGKNDSPYFGVRWFIYPLGAQYLTDAWLSGGNAAVRHAYAYPRQFMQQFVAGYGHPAKVLDPPLACPIATPSASYGLVGNDRFGALIVYGFLRRGGVPDADAWSLASAWNDDRIFVFFDAEAEVALMTWVIRFEREEDPLRVLKLFGIADPRLRIEARGRDLILSAVSDASVADWRGGLDCLAP